VIGMDDIVRQLCELLNPHVAEQPREQPIAMQLHIGERAYELLRTMTAVEDRPADFAVPRVRTVDHLLGVPVVVGSVQAPLPLDPMGWRLIDSNDGRIIDQGVLSE
jgi:hypothetical protein